MQKQNIINKRIELEDIEQVAKILLNKQEDLANKAKQGEQEAQYTDGKTQKNKVSVNKISIDIHYKDGMKISKDDAYSWFISEMYANRANIEQIWIKYYAMYYENYELGANSIMTIEQYDVWIRENSISIDSRSDNCDNRVYATVEEIRNVFAKCPEKYDRTIKGKFFRSQALYLAIGLIIAIILALFTKFSLMPTYELLATALNNKIVFILAYIFVAELSGTLIGNGIIASMYKRISPKQKYVGYNRKTRTNTYIDDLDDYKANPEVMIGVNAYNTSDRIKIEKMYSVCKKIILIELLISVVIGMIFYI